MPKAWRDAPPSGGARAWRATRSCTIRRWGGGGRRCRAGNSGGPLISIDLRGNWEKGRPPEKPRRGSGAPAAPWRDIFIPKIPNVEPLAAELGHFVRVARGEEAPRAGAEDGVREVRVLEAASRSLAGAGAPVSL